MSFFLLAAQKQGGGQYLRRANMFGPSTPIEPATYYTPGNRSPAVSTSDYYLIGGCYWFRCYDLLTMGATGAAIAAASGRYVWLNSTDHFDPNFDWSDGMDALRVGFSSDPGIPPATMNQGIKVEDVFNFGGQTNYFFYQVPYLVYNPDDAATPFWVYFEGQAASIQHETGMAKSADLISWTKVGYTHKNNTFLDWSSFQRVVRVGTGSWYSVGLSTLASNYGGYGKWTSTDGLTFTQVSTGLTDTVNNSTVVFAGTDLVNISGQDYALVKEEVYNIDPYPSTTWVHGAVATGAVRIGQYVSLCPVDSNFNALASPDMIRISDVYSGVYPAPSYLQIPVGYVEDGVLHVWASHGFYPSSANNLLVNGAPFVLGGGLQEEFIDYYTYIIDSTAAVAAAPVSVSASCDTGVVTLSWYDALPNRTYRVYKGSSAGTQATLVGDVTGTSVTDSPTVGQWWYKVVTLDSGTERANRVVHTYVSSHSELANKHINRVIDDGGDVTTINQTWLQACIDWAVDNDMDDCIEFWADAAFGVKLAAGKVVKVYCLGTTILPRGGDLTMSTTNVTYSATGLNSTAPAWTNPATTDRAYWGGERVNNIRQKLQCTFFAAYKKPDTNKASFIGSDVGNVNPGLGLEHVSGSPGSASFYIKDASLSAVTATATLASATGVNVILGIFDGTNVTAYGNGTAGTPQTGLDPNLQLANNHTLRGKRGITTPFPCVASGCSITQCTVSPVVRTYQRSEAKWTASTIGMFSKGFTDAQAVSFDAMQATHIGR